MPIGSERVFLLDTGAVRRRAGTLRRSVLADSAYVSALAVIELIAGTLASEKEFRFRRAAVNALFESNTHVDWQFPEAKIYSAFPSLRSKFDFFEDRAADLQTIVKFVRGANSLDEFRRALGRAGLKYDLEFFTKYDGEYGDDYIMAGIDWARSGRGVFEANRPLHIIRGLGLSDDVRYPEYIRSLQGTAFATTMAKAGLVQRVMEGQRLSGEPWDSPLFAEYDGSVDAFIHGLSWWTFEQAIGRSSSRNDAIDLAHLLYLVPGASLVTTDRALASCAAAIGVSVIGPSSSIASGG